MPTFIALLRGVNVGKANRVPMESLRNLLAGLGYSDVRTLLNSGNAVFKSGSASAPAHAAAIGRTLSENLAIDVPVIVKSAMQFEVIVDECPFAQVAKDPSRLLVAFMQDARGLASLGGIERLVASPEAFAIGRQAAYLHCAGGILESRAAAALPGRDGRAVTTRNWATVLKLQALVRSGAA